MKKLILARSTLQVAPYLMAGTYFRNSFTIASRSSGVTTIFFPPVVSNKT